MKASIQQHCRYAASSGPESKRMTARTRPKLGLLLCLFCCWITDCQPKPSWLFCQGYASPELKQLWAQPNYNMAKAITIIEECSDKGQPRPDLFGAVKYLDRFAANQHYTTLESKQALLDQTFGSWELRLALNSDRDQDFYPHPEFRALAMAFISVDDSYFGKGIATGPGFCFVALGGPSTRNVATRQIFMDYQDYYINGQTVPGWDLSYYIRGYQRNWVAAERKRPPLGFTVVAATPKVLVVRGNKTGGMAIFRRINDDMRPVAGFA